MVWQGRDPPVVQCMLSYPLVFSAPSVGCFGCVGEKKHVGTASPNVSLHESRECCCQIFFLNRRFVADNSILRKIRNPKVGAKNCSFKYGKTMCQNEVWMWLLLSLMWSTRTILQYVSFYLCPVLLATFKEIFSTPFYGVTRTGTWACFTSSLPRERVLVGIFLLYFFHVMFITGNSILI